jgi:hypothetical protein
MLMEAFGLADVSCGTYYISIKDLAIIAPNFCQLTVGKEEYRKGTTLGSSKSLNELPVPWVE